MATGRWPFPLRETRWGRGKIAPAVEAFSQRKLKEVVAGRGRGHCYENHWEDFLCLQNVHVHVLCGRNVNTNAVHMQHEWFAGE